jgi:hypothetical protein
MTPLAKYRDSLTAKQLPLRSASFVPHIMTRFTEDFHVFRFFMTKVPVVQMMQLQRAMSCPASFTSRSTLRKDRNPENLPFGRIDVLVVFDPPRIMILPTWFADKFWLGIKIFLLLAHHRDEFSILFANR